MNLPHLSISFAAGATRKLELAIENCTIPARAFDSEQATLIVFGTPIHGNNIVYNEIWAEVTDDGLPPGFLGDLNGEFLLVTLDKKSGTLRI